jgi:hypothetical protein
VYPSKLQITCVRLANSLHDVYPAGARLIPKSKSQQCPKSASFSFTPSMMQIVGSRSLSVIDYMFSTPQVTGERERERMRERERDSDTTSTVLSFLFVTFIL